MRQTKIVVARYGGPGVITVTKQKCPAPMVGEVWVKVLAAGVSLPDVLAREGVHPETPLRVRVRRLLVRLAYCPIGQSPWHLGNLGIFTISPHISSSAGDNFKKPSNFVQRRHEVEEEGLCELLTCS